MSRATIRARVAADYYAMSRQDVPALLRVADAAAALVPEGPTADFPEGEWDPRFLALLDALAALEALP